MAEESFRYIVYPILREGDQYQIGFQQPLFSSDHKDVAETEAAKHNLSYTHGVIVIDHTTGHAWSPDNKAERATKSTD
jgi:hypothetical protein